MTATMQPRRFSSVANLPAGAKITDAHGRVQTVERIERSPDRYHWRIYYVGVERYEVVPNGARATLQ